MKFPCRFAASLLVLLPLSRAAEPFRILVEEDFRSGEIHAPDWRPLPNPLPGTGLQPTPGRAAQGVPHALVRDLREAPLWPDGRLNIARNEVEQGMHQVWDPGILFDPAEALLVMRTTTFSDATTGGTNSIAVRLWVQRDTGPNLHKERMELSTHFNAHPRGSRQVYPNAYVVRDGWETWAMPEGNNSRRAGIYYRLAAEGRNEEIRGPLAVPLGHYWDWQGLDWPRGWTPPLGGGLFPPPPRDATVFPGGGLYTTTAIFVRTSEALPEFPHEFATRVDLLAPRHRGRITLLAPLPREINEIRLILRSETPPEGREWLLAEGADPAAPLWLGVADVRVWLTSRADVNLDGRVDLQDWEALRQGQDRDAPLHTDGDLLGSGSVDLADAFFLAARLPESDAERPPPEAWTARFAEDGTLRLHAPPQSRLYAWRLIPPEGDAIEAELLSEFGTGGLQRQGPGEVGAADLRNPWLSDRGSEKSLARLPSPLRSGFRILLQPGPGVPAITLPVRLP